MSFSFSSMPLMANCQAANSSASSTATFPADFFHSGTDGAPVDIQKLLEMTQSMLLQTQQQLFGASNDMANDRECQMSRDQPAFDSNEEEEPGEEVLFWRHRRPTIAMLQPAQNVPICAESSGNGQKGGESVALGQEASPGNGQKLQGCTICRLEEAKVSHFGVPICTGCRAFFRRSVAQQKTYSCLRSRLCGTQKPVPNRRVCKFCRFQRCVAAGMLKSKEQFQVQQLEQHAQHGMSKALSMPKLNSAQKFRSISTTFSSSTSEESAGEDESKAVHLEGLALKSRPLDGHVLLEQFMLCRRKIAYERMQHFYTANGQEGQDVYNMNYAIKIAWKEAGFLQRILIGSLAPLNEISAMDKDVLFLEFAYCWSVLERVWTTIRNNGHQARRLYDYDGHFWQLNEDGANRHFGGPLAEILKDPHPAVHQAIQGFFFAGAISFLNGAREVAKAVLDEEEASALALLMFTRQEVLGMVSRESAKVLQGIRHGTLRYLAQHLSSQGRNLAERMATIVGLLAPLQECVLLCKRSATLMRSACTQESLPNDFLKLMDKTALEMQRMGISSN